MTNCSCPKCTELDNKDKQRALDEWNNGRHDIRYESWDYECGDGCCSDYGTNLYVNDYLVTQYASDIYLLEFLGFELNITYGGDES